MKRRSDQLVQQRVEIVGRSEYWFSRLTEPSAIAVFGVNDAEPGSL
jgi:hypothetical protein